MNGQAPWLRGSSCTQTTSALGYFASSAAISLAGRGASCSTRKMAVWESFAFWRWPSRS
jgi:hypothetical protein